MKKKRTKAIRDGLILPDTIVPYSDLFEYCYHHGERSIDFLKKGDVKKISTKERKRFIKKCHEGWKIAQVIILQKILELEAEQILIRKEVKGKIHRLSQRNRYLYDVLESHKNRLRDFANGIVWQIYGLDKSRIRAGIVTNRAHGFLKDKNIESYSLYIDKINERSDSFALIADITTVLGNGDILQVDNGKIALIEVKEGKVNEELSEIIYDDKLDPESMIKTVFEKYENNKAAIKQFKRRLKQEVRAGLSMEYEKDKTSRVDHILQHKVSVVELDHIDDHYLYNVEALCEKVLSGSCLEKCVIDKCLFVAVIRGVYADEISFLIKHDIYHQFYNSKCYLSSDNDEKRKEEFISISKIKIERLEYVFGMPGMLPLTAWLSNIDTDVSKRILSGELKVFTFLHMPSFMDLAKKMNFSVKLKGAKNQTYIDKCNYSWNNKNIIFDDIIYMSVTSYVEMCCLFDKPSNMLHKTRLSAEALKSIVMNKSGLKFINKS